MNQGQDIVAARIDLHTHTTASDGLLAPAELVQAARDAGLQVIAVTDHDTIDGPRSERRPAVITPQR